jgi:hypothetical protein
MLAEGGRDNNIYFHTPFTKAETEAARDFNRKHKMLMSRHEMINKRIKQFDILRRYRHNNDQKHMVCFGAIINITQLALEVEPLPEVDKEKLLM